MAGRPCPFTTVAAEWTKKSAPERPSRFLPPRRLGLEQALASVKCMGLSRRQAEGSSSIPDREPEPSCGFCLRVDLGMKMARVLIVEDEGLVRELAVDEFSDAGFAVEEAANGDEALELLKGGIPFDV